MANDHPPVEQNNINAEYGSMLSKCGVCGRSIVNDDPRLCPKCASFTLRAVSQFMEENDLFQALDSDPDKAGYQHFSNIKMRLELSKDKGPEK